MRLKKRFGVRSWVLAVGGMPLVLAQHPTHLIVIEVLALSGAVKLCALASDQVVVQFAEN